MDTLLRALGRGPHQSSASASVTDYKGKEKDKLSLNTAAILARHDNEQPLSSPRVEILGVHSARGASSNAGAISQPPPGLATMPPLHEAVIGNNAREVIALSATRARLDETDPQGNTALHVAASMGSTRHAEVMLKAGAAANARNHIGSTPLHMAALNGHRKVTKLLLKSGANIEEKDVSGNTPLLSAAMQGHFKLVQKLAAAGAHLLIANSEGNTGLHYAASTGDLDTLLLYLMNNKAAPDPQNNERATPLHYACGADKEKCAEMLIEYGALPGAPDKSLATPMHYAAKRKALACVRTLLSYHVDIGVVDKDGLTALHQACTAGSLDIVERLIKAGASINATDRGGETPLHKAANTGFASIISTLIEKDATTDCTDNHHRTPLYVAARSGHTRCVELFLNLQSKRNVNVLEITDTKGRTPLHAACTYGRWETTFLLLQMGALPNAQDSNGLAALHEAAINGDDVSMSFLISKRCNLLLTSNEGLTALHWASLNGHLRCVQLLIEQGVTVDISDASGDTPLHYAVKRNNVHVAAFLLHSKASVSVANKQGLTPLHYAVRHGAVECVVRLVEAGADIRAADRDKMTPYVLAKREGDQQMRLMFKFLKKNNHQTGLGKHVFHDFRRLRAPVRPESNVTSPSAAFEAATMSTSTTGVEKNISTSATLTAKQRAAYAAVTKAPPALLSPKRVLTDVNFNDMAEVVEVVQSEASKQNMRTAYASVLRLLLLVPDDLAMGTKVLQVLEQAMGLVLMGDPRKAVRLDTELFLDALRKKGTMDDAQRAESLMMIERSLPQLFEERRSGVKTPRGSGKSPRGTQAISPRGGTGGAVAAKPPPPPPPPPMLKRLTLQKVADSANSSHNSASGPAVTIAADAKKDGTESLAIESVAANAPPPPPVAKAGPPPPPMLKAGAARAVPQNQRVKLRKLNWEKVPIGLIPKTVWSNARPAEFDTAALTEDFQERDPKKTQTQQMVGQVQKRQIVELRRANQVGVLMAALKAPPVTIKEMIMKGEDNAITEDGLRALIRLVPKDEEIELLTPYKNQPHDVLRTLGQAEKLYLELMDVPRLKARLEALLFRRTFPVDVRRLKERTQRAFNGINQLRTAPKLRALLELILAIGNYLNDGTAVGQAMGFRLEALQKLDGTRSPVKKDFSLMNFIVGFVMDQRPQLTTLEEELIEVKFARLEEINDIVAEEAALRTQVDSLSADLAQPKVSKKDTLRKQLVSFESTVRDQSRELTERLNVMRTAYEELLVYYAAERGADIAAYVLEFVKMFKRVEFAVVRSREMAAAKAKAKADKATKVQHTDSRKKGTMNRQKLQQNAPNLQVKLAMEGKPQTFANPLMDIDLDRVARRRSRTLSPEITALLTARLEHSQDPNNPTGKSPRNRNAGDRDAIQRSGGLSRSPSLNNTRDATKVDAIGHAPAEPARDATTRKRMTLGRRVMNPILSIFSIGPAVREPEPTHRAHMHTHAHAQPGQSLRRSTSVQPAGSIDNITHSTSHYDLQTASRNGTTNAGRRKRRDKPVDRNNIVGTGEPIEVVRTGIEKRASEPLRSSQHQALRRSQDDITKGKERMEPRDGRAPPSRTSSVSLSASSAASPRRMHTLRSVASKESLKNDNTTSSSPASHLSPPATDRSTIDSQPARQQFAKLRPVPAADPNAQHSPKRPSKEPSSTAPLVVSHTEVKPEPKEQKKKSEPAKIPSSTSATTSVTLPASVSTASLQSVNHSPRKKEQAKLPSKASKDLKSSQDARRSSTFGVRLQPVAVDDKRSMPLPVSEIQKERAKVIQRVRERTAKEQSEGGEKRLKPEAPMATPSATVFPPELMQEVKVEDLLKEQFAGEKENALLLGEMPLLTKKRHSLNVTELFGVHIMRSTSQDLAAQKQLSARGSARGANVKLAARTATDDASVLREADINKKTAKEKKAEPIEEPVEELTPVNPEALRQLKALYPHLLDSVLESLLRSADGDVEQATLYLQKKGWVSQEPAAANAHQNEAKASPAKKSSAFSTLRNILGGKKNPFALPEGQSTTRGSSKTVSGDHPTKRKGVKF